MNIQRSAISVWFLGVKWSEACQENLSKVKYKYTIKKEAQSMEVSLGSGGHTTLRNIVPAHTVGDKEGCQL